jgi:SAM-dependent methyltransferase
MVLPGAIRLREWNKARQAEEREGLPPARLRVAVDGSGDPDWFLRSGAEVARVIREAVPVEGDVLDFGCGCGRVARHLPGVNGCDYNPRLVAWCAENLPGEFRVNELEPPAPYEAESFDLVYAISILTHLTEELSQAWVADWHRILRPGGRLLVTVHGDAYRAQLGRRLGERYDAGEVAVHNAPRRGSNACAAHHPRPYMERLLAGFATVEHRPGVPGEVLRQDVYVATKRI